jgi:hypothetical protein
VSWFAVGCYYMSAQQYEAARRYFAKSTSLDRCFAPAWVAFGNAFAAQDESDQVRCGVLPTGCVRAFACLCVYAETDIKRMGHIGWRPARTGVLLNCAANHTAINVWG